MTQIAVFVGSLREASKNKSLAGAIEKLLPEDFTFEYVDIGSLPLFNEELEADFPAAAQKAKDLVKASDGVLFITPEYNRGVPGVLKNAIDWISRPSALNSFPGKPAAVAGSSVGSWGTTFAQTQLKSSLLYLDMKVMGQPEMYVPHNLEIFDEQGHLMEDHKERLQHFVDTFVKHVSDNK